MNDGYEIFEKYIRHFLDIYALLRHYAFPQNYILL